MLLVTAHLSLAGNLQELAISKQLDACKLTSSKHHHKIMRGCCMLGGDHDLKLLNVR